ncbi:hypothetical protein QTP88_014679 [Uroleucon formosanum]
MSRKSGHKCFYFNCGKSGRTVSGLKLYRCPKNPELQQQWVINSEQKRIRLSGAAYRKQKLKRDEEIKKNSGSFEKYLKKNNEVLNNPETHSKIILEESNTLEVTDNLKEVGNSEQTSDSIDIFNNEINTTLEENTNIKYNENENNISDPGTWPAIFSDSLRLQLVKIGPTKPNKDFKYPRDALNRRFPISILSKALKNGEVIERTWLIYSVKNDVVYCFCCKIFSSENYALTKFGCNDWKNVHNIVKEHETSKIHFISLKKWMELSARLNSNQTIDAAHQRVLNNGTRHWQTGEIFDSLYEISQDTSFDQITRLEAESLAKKIKNFNFVCCVVIWHSILNQINLASKVLQKVTLDISGAENILSETINFLKKIRYDESFDKFLKDAETIALELDIEASFTQQISIRPRKKKTVFFSYEQPDEPIINLKTKFKVELYFYILDVALNSLEERFEQLHNHCYNFKFLYDISSLKSITKDNIVKNCMDLQLLLSENENVSNSDIDAIEMTDELVAISELLKPNSTPLEVLQFIVNNNNFVPNVAVALRIILTMPVSVASGERSFSKLKIIKNYLRSSMNQERLSDLATISIEKEVMENLEFKSLLIDFAQEKVRKINFI